MLTAVFLIVFAIFCFAVIQASDDGDQAENEDFKAVKSCIDAMRNNPDNAAYKSKLDRIYEAYAGCTCGNVSADEAIKENIYELNSLLFTKQIEQRIISEQCEQIMKLIEQRGLRKDRLK